MKKIGLLMVFVSLAWITIAQVSPKASDFSGNVKVPEIVHNGNRSTPPGTQIFSQPLLSCPSYNGNASVTNFLVYNGSVESANDFILLSDAEINCVRWWFFVNDNPLTTNWIIRFYNNESCLPSSLVATFNISAADVNYEYLCNGFGMPIYDCWANLGGTFSAQAYEDYWISIQAIGAYEWWCTFGFSCQYWNCGSAYKFPDAGISDFVPVNSVFGCEADFTFELYNAETPPLETPISNWAVGIGIFLILAAAVVRFRKLV